MASVSTLRKNASARSMSVANRHPYPHTFPPSPRRHRPACTKCRYSLPASIPVLFKSAEPLFQNRRALSRSFALSSIRLRPFLVKSKSSEARFAALKCRLQAPQAASALQAHWISDPLFSGNSRTIISEPMSTTHTETTSAYNSPISTPHTKHHSRRDHRHRTHTAYRRNEQPQRRSTAV